MLHTGAHNLSVCCVCNSLLWARKRSVIDSMRVIGPSFSSCFSSSQSEGSRHQGWRVVCARKNGLHSFALPLSGLSIRQAWITLFALHKYNLGELLCSELQQAG